MSEPVPASESTLRQLGMNAALLANLTPDLRELFLEYMQVWSQPAETLEVVELLREAHGPLLFLLDVQAAALLAAGDPARAIEVNERRQRRSTTIASQALEARALMALERTRQAHDVAQELLHAYPRSWIALAVAAEVMAGAGDFTAARLLLDEWLQAHTGDLAATLTMARLAHLAGERALATEMAERLGPGVPTELTAVELKGLAVLLQALGRIESQRAVELELERQRNQQWSRLAEALTAFTTLDLILVAGGRADGNEIYRRLNGPEAVTLSHEEKRHVLLAAVRNFGFSTLRVGQAETVACVLRGESVLAIMPTGAGKSLCYQLPALTLPRMSLVISPLIALMKDQVESLPHAARMRATFVNSTLTDEEIDERMRGIAAGKYKLVYAAPERLRQREFLRTLRASGLDLFIIDEAHCVSLWGHDFRPDYLFLQEARRELGTPTTLAMTATAPPRVRDEILDFMVADDDSSAHSVAERAQDGADLPMPTAPSAAPRGIAPRVIALDIFRSNLFLSALKFNNEEEKRDAVVKFVADTPGSGIVYVNTRHKAETLAFALRQAGVAADAYHAGLENRNAVQDRFMSDATRVVVATVAFGMGIDKPDIRFIVHFHPSRSLAGYYQEVGRAGRDGKPSQGVLFYSNNDWANLRRWARSDEYDVTFLRRVYAAIATQLGVNEGEQAGTVSGPVEARRLQQVLDVDETTMRVAVSLLERADLLGRGFDVAQELTLSLPRTLPATARQNPHFRDLVRGLKLGPGQSGGFKMASIARSMGCSLSDCEGALLDWQSQGFLTLKLGRRAMAIDLPPPPADLEARLERLLAQAQALSQRRIDDMAGYATAESCRHGYISAQFGSPPRSRCNVCDNCTGLRPAIPAPHEVVHLTPDDADIQPMILDCLVSLPRPVGRSGLARILSGHLRSPFTPDKARHHGALKGLGESGIIEYVDDLLESGRLRQYERNGFVVLAPTAAGRAEAEAWLGDHPELAGLAEALDPEMVADAPVEAGGEAGGGADPVQYTGLQRALWQWRRRLAEELGQPAYVVLPYELMLQIVETRPKTLEALGALSGMGAMRLERVGPTILDLVHLNPEQPGDRDALAAQRANHDEAHTQATAQRSATVRPVSARTEKLILMKLQEIRQKVAVSGGARTAEIAPNALLNQIARSAPATLSELDAILGFRSSGLRNEGPQIITYIAALRTLES